MIRTLITNSGDSPSPRTFHASAVIESAIYIHGGLDTSNKVLSDLYRYDVPLHSWSKIGQNSESTCTDDTKKETVPFRIEGICSEPSLSHHCAIAYKERYIVLIGGWNGRKRTSEVFIFDTVECSWYKAKNSGDIPVGLSSHIANLVSENEILITGREGGVHTQRRTGNAFMLNLSTGVYKSQAYNVESRSGHTADVIRYGKERGFRLFIYSGRKTGLQYNTIGNWSCKYWKGHHIDHNFAENLASLVRNSPAADTPEGRQNCKSLCINDRFVLIYGGELWKARDNVTSDIFGFDCADLTWHKIPTGQSLPKLVGFSMDVGIDGKCYVFGGTNGKSSNDQLWNLEVQCST